MRELTAHKPTVFKSIIPLLALGLYAAGCGTAALLAGRFEPPHLRLVGSKVTALTAQSVSVVMYLEAENPNTYPLHVGDLTYQLQIGDSVVAHGGLSSRVNVPALATAPLELPVEVSVARLLQEAAAGVMLGEIPYTLEATLSVGSLFSQHPVTLTESSVFLLNLPLGLAGHDRHTTNGIAGHRAGA